MHQTQQEIHNHINTKIAYILKGYSTDLSTHDIDSSTVEWKRQNTSNIQLKYIKDSNI
jgi:Zn/Cd-binding protein ZinT